MGQRFENATRTGASYRAKLSIRSTLPVRTSRLHVQVSGPVTGKPQATEWMAGAGRFRVPHLRAAYVSCPFRWRIDNDPEQPLKTGPASVIAVSWFAFSGFTGSFDPDGDGTDQPSYGKADEISPDTFKFATGAYEIHFAIVGDPMITFRPGAVPGL